MTTVTALLAGGWAFLLANPWAVLGALSGLAGLVFTIRRAFGKRLKPEERDRVLGIALPLIAAGKALAEKTKNPWDNVVVGVAEKIAAELQSEGLDAKPAAVVAALKPHLDAPTVAAELAAKLRKGKK